MQFTFVCDCGKTEDRKIGCNLILSLELVKIIGYCFLPPFDSPWNTRLSLSGPQQTLRLT